MPGDVAQWLESQFKSDDPGFYPLVGQGDGQVFFPSESTLVLMIDLFVCTACAQMCAHVKDPTGGTGV